MIYTILGMALVTYLTRALPLLLMSRCSLPPLLLRWLRLVPLAVLAALVAPELLLVEDRLQPINLYSLAALPTFFVAAKSRNLLYTVLTGLVAVAVLRLF